mgnify:CR=1 FL=1
MRRSALLPVLLGLALLAPVVLAEPASERARIGGYLGIFVRETSPGTIVVERVHEGSGAEAAGLRAGDVIEAVNGIELENADELIRRLWSPRKITLNVKRGEESLEIKTSSAELDDYSTIGDPAPRFELPKRDGSGTVSLDALLAKGKPVVLVFGSYT